VATALLATLVGAAMPALRRELLRQDETQ